MSALEWVVIGLLVFAVLLFVGEGFLPTGGILALVGGLAVALAAIAILVQWLPSSGGDWLVVGATITALLLVIVATGSAIRLRHMAPLTGPESMIGRNGHARSDLDPRGFVFVNGEYWSAQCEEGSILKGDPIIITAVNGLSLTVRRADSKGATR